MNQTSDREHQGWETRVSLLLGQSSNDPAALREALHGLWAHAQHLHAQIHELHVQLEAIGATGEPPAKKRKLPEHLASSQANGTAAWRTGNMVTAVKDVSFSAPMRKKMTLEIVNAGNGRPGGLRVVNPASGEAEVGIDWAQVEQVMLVPVPEKAQPAFIFVVIPSASTGVAAESKDSPEAFVWSVPAAGAPKDVFGDTVHDDDTHVIIMQRLINRQGVAVTRPSDDEFVSNIVQAHRKAEKAYHVKAWKGSKEGFLYLLGPGILFGFKKPLQFFPLESIASISYTSVLQRTFNLVIAAGDPAAPTDVEFAMLDQLDFAPIDAYVKRHGLNDASLAASRRAQKPKAAVAADADAGGEDGGDDEGELARAERELQDAEDEEEEDFDPGSGGESDGSGSESGEDDGYGHEDADVEAEDYEDDVEE